MIPSIAQSPSILHPKVALVHDSFFIKGGAERMNIEIAKILNADIFAAVFKTESYDVYGMGFTGRCIEIFPSFRRGMVGFILMKIAFLLKSSALRAYSVTIFSNEAISARIWAKNSKKIYYAHSISRHLFDQKEDYLQKVAKSFRPIFSFALSILRWWYIRDLQAMDLILANSEKNADFLRTLAPNVRIEVLYPPVDTTEFFPLASAELETQNIESVSQTYFLSYARLAHAKRIDEIIRAFLCLPELHLKIVYGINDPQLEEFRALANGAANIEFVTLKDNSVLPDLVRNAIATICISKNEDFGMVAIESMASGVPVIAVREGGYRETMIDGVTGILLEPDFSTDQLVSAIQSMTPKFAASLGVSSRKQAEKFSVTTFSQRLKRLIF